MTSFKDDPNHVLQGTNADQDNRFSDKEKKLLKQMKFEEILSKKVIKNSYFNFCIEMLSNLVVVRFSGYWDKFMLVFLQPT